MRKLLRSWLRKHTVWERSSIRFNERSLLLRTIDGYVTINLRFWFLLWRSFSTPWTFTLFSFFRFIFLSFVFRRWVEWSSSTCYLLLIFLKSRFSLWWFWSWWFRTRLFFWWLAWLVICGHCRVSLWIFRFRCLRFNHSSFLVW